jgi:hypothetical protein
MINVYVEIYKHGDDQNFDVISNKFNILRCLFK